MSTPYSIPEIDVVVVKQWFYCPRFVYLRYTLNIKEPRFEYLSDGRRLHEELSKREEIRKSLLLRSSFRYCKKLLQVRVYSKRLGLRGVLDMLVIREDRPVPIEVKLADIHHVVPIHHKAQLAAYALCLEEMFCKVVKEGYLYYIKSDKLVPVNISDDLKKLVIQELNRIRACLLDQEIPERARDPRKCVNCWFRKICEKMKF